jgi:hypothetical protein
MPLFRKVMTNARPNRSVSVVIKLVVKRQRKLGLIFGIGKKSFSSVPRANRLWCASSLISKLYWGLFPRV